MIGRTVLVKKLLMAIQEYEGWYPPDLGKFPDGSIAWRNKNPGNLRSSPFEIGKRYGYSYFLDDITGFAALEWDLWQKSRGLTSTGLNDKSDLRALFKVYAPP